MKKTRPEIYYQLKDSPFYNLAAKARLAALLRVSPATLAELSSGKPMYVRCWKHKKLNQWLRNTPATDMADSYRPIDIPDPRLKSVQSRIATLLSRIQPPDFLFSPVKGRSYVENAARHIGSKAFWLLDVADYFPSCSANNVARFFHRDMRCSPDVTALLVKLVSLNGCLPQGAPCSPILAYYCNRPMWLAIEDSVKKGNCKLSLYADDLTISGDIVRKKMIWDIKKIVHGSGLRFKSSKEHSLIHSPADITGVIVKAEGTHLPNRQFKKLVDLKRQRAVAQNPSDKAKLEKQIAGRIAQRRQVESNRRVAETHAFPEPSDARHPP
jgi:hypothetical protein